MTIRPRSAPWLAALLIIAIGLSYADAFRGTFVFDDLPGILQNPTIRPGAPISAIWFPPGARAGTVGGRPLANASLALNYAISGPAVWSYHLLNLAVHITAALLLFGSIRRAIRTGQNDRDADAIAFAAALLWGIHPLQTESVTYIIQRAESLAGACYVASIYCFIRAVGRSAGSSGWLAASVLACLAGVATKETAATAPLLVLLYDRAFVAGTFREARRRRSLFHGCMFAVWLPLALLERETKDRGGSVALGVGRALWSHWLTQCHALWLYVRLAVWPRPLVFDYGPAVAAPFGAVWWQGLLVLLALAATIRGVVRNTPAGFMGACFFLFLAPSSSFVRVITQPMAEHRMYLALACLTVAAATAWRRMVSRWSRRAMAFWLPVGLVSAALGAATAERNMAYRSSLALWRDTVAKAPGNVRALCNLGVALQETKQPVEALASFRAAIQADAGYLPAQFDYGAALLDAGRPGDAIPHLTLALADPLHAAEANLYLGESLAKVGRNVEAVAYDREAVRLAPADLEANLQYGNDLAAVGRFGEAATAFRRAVTLAPRIIPLRYNLARALLECGQPAAAIAECREILRQAPGDETARLTLELAERYRAGQ